MIIEILWSGTYKGMQALRCHTLPACPRYLSPGMQGRPVNETGMLTSSMPARGCDTWSLSLPRVVNHSEAWFASHQTTFSLKTGAIYRPWLLEQACSIVFQKLSPLQCHGLLCQHVQQDQMSNRFYNGINCCYKRSFITALTVVINALL